MILSVYITMNYFVKTWSHTTNNEEVFSFSYLSSCISLMKLHAFHRRLGGPLLILFNFEVRSMKDIIHILSVYWSIETNLHIIETVKWENIFDVPTLLPRHHLYSMVG